MDRVVCNGLESSIGDCQYLGSNALRACTHSEDAGVRCHLGEIHKNAMRFITRYIYACGYGLIIIYYSIYVYTEWVII